ncbi:MarR family winged helix-turn-helix transcriptional regulator [Actinomadura macrotermitis]|uniref:Organic hydroperoxide resistance transcriptional regulator n=1 Tax=Actinomadura macrotermitis TaxID=2585200 RepID=A0A7K0C752_9ACTN|nr:MarR family transcriptional regulator [Actinomadura macrotermitis]MQY09265.1 Organic hydroperoxide resistance transcriptional regulator [Actinomadura macrotermitis]
MTVDMLALDAQVCFAVHRASRAFDALYRTELRDLGLTYPQYLVMLALWEEDGPTVKRLGERLRLDSGTLSPLLKRLEAAGMVERVRSRADERSVSVHLTGQGAALRSRAAEVPRRILASTGLDLRELADLHATLGRVTERLDAAARAARPE